MLLFYACNSKTNTDATGEGNVVIIPDSTRKGIDSIIKSFNDEDNFVNEHLSENLNIIRTNYRRINSIANWEKVIVHDLYESLEGGEARFYYQDKKLEKIATRHFGETFQQLTEYYLLNGKISFVFEQLYKYNRPIYHDSIVMKETNDSEVFDLDKSEIVAERFYFQNDKLIHLSRNPNPKSPFSTQYIIEQERRILDDFEKLIREHKAG